MFSTARYFLPVRPQPLAATPCRRTPALTAVSARPRRGGSLPRRNRRSWDDGNDDDGDDRIDDSFFGDTQDEEAEDDEEAPGPEQQRRPASPALEPAGQLRGSDVLRALQRAAAAKEAKKKKKKPGARRQEKGGDGVKVKAAGEVRPIEIRPEWAPRIRELELRLQQLVDKQFWRQPTRKCTFGTAAYLMYDLPVVANIAQVVIDESGPYARDWVTWRQVFLLVDVVCCCAVLFPIVWSIKNLREAARSDGKAAVNLMKLTLFRQYYVLVICYIYFTRVVVYALVTITSYRYLWTSVVAGELATLAFYVFTGYKFRPEVHNPYFAIDDDEEEAASEALKLDDEFEL